MLKHLIYLRTEYLMETTSYQGHILLIEIAIIQILMEIECNLLQDIEVVLQVQQPYVVMALIALAKVEEVHVRIMVV